MRETESVMGATLRELLTETGETQAMFAARLGVSQKYLSQLILGLVPLTPRMALRLEAQTDVPMRMWLRLQVEDDVRRMHEGAS